MLVVFFEQKTAYEVRISDWSSDVCSSDLLAIEVAPLLLQLPHHCVRGHEAPVGQHQHVFAIISNRVGVDRVEDQRAVMAELLLKTRMAVIPEGAGMPDRELVDEGFPGADAGEAHARHAVHLEGQQHAVPVDRGVLFRSEEHTSELQSLMRIS